MQLRVLVGAGVLSMAALALAHPGEVFDARLEGLRSGRHHGYVLLAETAEKKGDIDMARRCLVRAVAVDATLGDAAGRLEELRDQDDSPKLKDKTRAKHRAALDKFCNDAAAKTAELAKWGTTQDVGDIVQELAAQAVALDPDNEDARELLGHKYVKKWGWVEAEDAAKLAAGELPVGSGWKPKKGLGKSPRAWGEQWRVTSDHFVIHSNLDLDRVFEARDLLEALRRKFIADWEGLVMLVADPPRHDVFIFARKSEYRSFLDSNEPGVPDSVPGLYSPDSRRSMFYDVEIERAAGGQTSTLVELMLHECAHQLFRELLKDMNVSGFDSASSPNAWIHEGIAEWYGMHTPGKKGLMVEEKAVRAMLRTRQVKENMSLVTSASELIAMKKSEFQSPDGNQRVTNYSVAGFLCLWMTENGHRTPLRRLVQAIYTRGNRADALETSLGASPDTLDEGFAKYLRGL